MPDIFHTFPINTSAERVFRAISTPEGLDCWWTKSANGKVGLGEVYDLFFGEGYHWTGLVSKYIPDKEFELTMTNADSDWLNTKVGFLLSPEGETTVLAFYHTGWPAINEHYRISNFCWAMYLRILKRYLELGEQVVYEERLNV